MIDNYAGRFRFPVQLAGNAALRIVSEVVHGRVAALFDSCFYIETAAGFICLGNEDFEPCPLNLVTAAPAGTNWPASGVRLNENVYIYNNTVGVGSRFSFPMSSTCTWSPNSVSGFDSLDLERGIRIFREASANCVESEGLGFFILPQFHPDHEHAVLKAARRPIAELQHWLKATLRRPNQRVMQEPEAVHSLIGLGSGLTPSGDDFIGGMMIALYAIGETDCCRKLWDLIRRSAEGASNPISWAHLKAASHGEGCEGVHSAISAILKGYPPAIQNCLPCINRIGHTSGWDIMAGAIIALDSWHEVRQCQSNLT